ncbi:MAG: LamB/YcsF family protein [Armatimonadetes bacterium]|nr:LamB/YcsF family protein [Armatimonadota bacterium]
MTRIDLNCDLGESFGPYTLGQDEALLGLVSSANIACGFHAGDPAVMARTVTLAVERGVAVGAHPGLPDLAGFGRRMMALTPKDVYSATLYQIGALEAFARRSGAPLRHVKPHGALYGMAEADPAIAQALAAAVRDFDPSLVLFGLAGGRLIQEGRAVGLAVAEEAFADRAYLPDGRLAPRHQPGAVLHDPDAAARRALRLVQEGRLAAVDGSDLTIRADTLCIHGDEPSALPVARAVRAALTGHGVEIRRPGDR